LIPSILILQAFYLVFQGLVAFGVLHRCALPYEPVIDAGKSNFRLSAENKKYCFYTLKFTDSGS